MNFCISLFRCCFRCKRRIVKYLGYEEVHAHHRISQTNLPWLFVGIELMSGKIIDKTEEAQSLVDVGITITPTTISKDVNVDDVKRYFYLDSVTLNEQEIPPEGLVIRE